MYNTALLPFVFNECRYLSSADLVAMLKKIDNYYYLDDINYLTINPSEQVLCGYFPDSDPVKNFYYAISTWNSTKENDTLISPKQIILNCRDFEYLERFIDLICKHKPQIRTICINLPYSCEKMINADQSKTVRENLAVLMKKYEGNFKESNCLYDFRFEPSFQSTADNLFTKYRLTETEDDASTTVFHVSDNNRLLFQYQPNMFSYRYSLFPSLRQPAKERLGINVISFTDDCHHKYQDNLPEDAIKFCLYAISCIYLKRGYVVKNITLPSAFENEDICTAIGMTRYRQFVNYKVQF